MNQRKWFFALVIIAALCLCGVATSNTQAAYAFEGTIDGEFEGWEGETVVRLMNGQIWIQVEYHYEYTYAFMPQVIIYQTGSGWKMKVEGTSTAVLVEQLR